MRTQQTVRSILVLALALASFPSAGRGQTPLPSSFTYQGRLLDGGLPANGTYDMEFSLWDAPEDGTQIGVTYMAVEIAVSEGLLTTSVDFGADAFGGDARWLQIGVRAAGGSAFTPLAPRRELTAAPHARFAVEAGSAPGDNLGSHAAMQDVDLGTSKLVAGDGTVNIDAASAVQLEVAGSRVWRAQSAGGTVSVVAGFAGNAATGSGATVSGGGIAGAANNAGGIGSAVGGGIGNAANLDYSTISGGSQNEAGGVGAMVGGGTGNRATRDYSTVAGGNSNVATGEFSTVGGGVINAASGDSSTVGGGVQNAAGAQLSTVGGGRNNGAAGEDSTIGGGRANTAGGAGVAGATVGGGIQNTASGPAATVDGGSGNAATGQFSTVGGGRNNGAGGVSSTISGGEENTASGLVAATVGGGVQNVASAEFSTVGGGSVNAASGPVATIGGGSENTANAFGATVGGGSENTAFGRDSAVGGGSLNAANGQGSTIGGGSLNTANALGATVPGGQFNQAGGDFSFAGGRRAKVRTPIEVSPTDIGGDEGTFMWADTNDIDFPSNGPNQFLVRATGGTTILSNAALTAGVRLNPGAGAWSSISDRAMKENVRPVDGREVLRALAAVPISTWNYISQDATIRHMGPMGQDLFAAFGLGENDTTISTIDADGVALAAIQGLNAKLDEAVRARDAEIERLRAQNAALEERLARLERRLGGE